jgi:hypothetical protein
LGAGLAAPAAAQSNAEGLLNNSWVFNLGGFIFQTGIKANLNGQSSQSPEIDFDETFGEADDATRGRLDARWRITPAHHLRFMYFDNADTRSSVLSEDVKWGDYTFLAGSSAEFRQEFKAYALAYEWAFMRSPTYEVAASLGVHYMDMQLALTGTVNGIDPDGNPVTGVSRTRTSDLPAPLPMIGLRAGWVVAPNWYVDAQAQFFKVKIDEYDGRWTDARVSATWMFHRNFGVGLGYNWFGTRLDVDKSDFNGRLKLSYSGLQAYLTGTF